MAEKSVEPTFILENSSYSTGLFNNTLVGFAIAYASSLELFEHVDQHKRLNVDLDGSVLGIDPLVLRNIARLLELGQVLTKTGPSEYGAGAFYGEITQTRGCFEWLLLGYGGLLVDIASARHPQKNTSYCTGRNGAVIATSSAKMARHFVDETFRKAVAAANFSSIVDLGCGDGSRLIALVKKHQLAKGVGVEIDPDAARIAESNIRQEGLEGRITILKKDVRTIGPNDFKSLLSPLIMMNFMGHDMWPKDNAKSTFVFLRKAFPRDCIFFMADTVRGPETGEPGILTAGFEFVHALLGKYIPSHGEWLQLFEETGWTLEKLVPFNVPETKLFILRIAS